MPIQALTVHDASQDAPKTSGAQAAPSAAASASTQGVYVVDNKDGKLRATFIPVQTGISGSTDIEVTGGLHEGQEIVTGPFKTLRTLKNGALIKRDTEKPKTPASGSNS